MTFTYIRHAALSAGDATGVIEIDALVKGGGAKWGPPYSYGAPVTVTFSFLSEDPGYSPDSVSGSFAPVTPVMKEGVYQAIAEWSAVTNIEFIEVSAEQGGMIQIGTADLLNGIGAAYYPGPNAYSGDVWIDNEFSFWRPGQLESIILHEFGHALGLKHPGPYGRHPEPPYLPDELDTREYTVMSYNVGPSYPDGIGPADIQAIQYLYGVPGQAYHNGTALGDILYGTGFDETMFAYGGDDYLFGRVGHDNLWGHEGDDVIYGNQGADIIYGNVGADRLYGGQDGDMIFAGLGADLVYGNLAGDIVYGNLDHDTIYAGQHNDVVFGGQGNDVIFANAGDDHVFGNKGDETIHGGPGLNTLVGGAGADTFFVDNDDIVVDPGPEDTVILLMG